MPHNGLLEVISKSQAFRRVLAGVEQPASRRLVSGLNGGALSLWLAALYQRTQCPFLVVAPSVAEGQRLVGDIETLLGPVASLFPARESLPGEVVARSSELEVARLVVLEQILQERRLVVAPVESMAQQLVPPAVIREARLTLRRGDSFDWDDLLARLEYLGYSRLDLVEVPGQYSVRGGLVDVYPLTADSSFRIEFFGDTIASLRTFSPKTQRSLAEVEEVTVGPAKEALFPPEVWDKGLATWQADYEAALNRLESRNRDAAQTLRRYAGERLERAQQKIRDSSIEDFLVYFYPEPQLLWHYFASRPLVVLVEPARLVESLDFLRRERLQVAGELLAQGRLLPRQVRRKPSLIQLLGSWSPSPVLGLASLPRQAPGLTWHDMQGVTAKHPPGELASRPGFLQESLRRWQAERHTQVLMLGGPQRARHVAEMLRDDGLTVTLNDSLNQTLPPGHLFVTWGGLSRGTELPDDKLVVLTETELYGQQRKSRPTKVFQEGIRLNAYTELQEDDFVVHVHHGIGRYKGIKRLNVGGVEKDYLLIHYAGQDRLYVPVEQIGLVHKYIGGGEEHQPRLSRLSSGEWAKVTSRVKNSVRDMARELLQLYAARQTAKGHAFSQDTVWQQEFEEAFPYRETPDQLRAIAETKTDMQRVKPMDRLLCGDVGYGKTEVALRAAFKAVMDDKQVAVLVPTTVLAQQHYRTFTERFASYPVRIDVLSRFRSPREQQQIVRAVALGQVDIIIGTHRLLSRDMKFKELGLLIIDEEQRFGVSHKERIKQWRQSVDALTLTATPIPRTLHMSLVGVRDMSLIETAPEDRFPVQTYVVEYSDELVREAIRRELGRGGQVYLVHNRIAYIETIANRVKELVPEARVAIGHGRLREDQLERVMVDFIEGHYDVLVCTTIIENGLDIPNVNTLIVDEADTLGLAQLYQLRGRVGRSNRLAYAYFTYRGDKTINPLAEKRLAAIKEFTALGSGFKIALRDLELRGAGNLLGAEQHGHMQAVGFNMYCQLLEEAVREQKDGKAPTPEKGLPSMDLSIDAYIEDSYIPGAGLKMEFYQRLLAVETPEEVTAMEKELQDRFGEPPPLTRSLLTMALLRALARQIKIADVQQQGKEVLVRFSNPQAYQGEILLRLAQRFPRRLAFSATGGLTMRVKAYDLDQTGLLQLLRDVFLALRSFAAPEPDAAKNFGS